MSPKVHTARRRKEAYLPVSYDREKKIFENYFLNLYNVKVKFKKILYQIYNNGVASFFNVIDGECSPI